MLTITARNVNGAYRQAVDLIRRFGVPEPSRAGDVLVYPSPMVTQYDRPNERVLFDTRRDANPFFHLFEALWMLSGRRDTPWLDRFVGDFSARFGERPNGEQHGAYGFRWRHHFDMEGGGHPTLPDQLATVIRLLRENPNDRRVVIQMWDPVADLGADKRDVPCNLCITPRINGGRLDITVFCRSNDIVWGCYGANAVHFSVLQEYLAAMIGVPIGCYYQVSNNWHAYVEVLDRVAPLGHVPDQGWYGASPSVEWTRPMVSAPEYWDEDLRRFMEWTVDFNAEAVSDNPPPHYANEWLSHTAEPLFVAHALFKAGDRDHAMEVVGDTAFDMAPDWGYVAKRWLERRSKKELK